MRHSARRAARRALIALGISMRAAGAEGFDELFATSAFPRVAFDGSSVGILIDRGFFDSNVSLLIVPRAGDPESAWSPPRLEFFGAAFADGAWVHALAPFNPFRPNDPLPSFEIWRSDGSVHELLADSSTELEDGTSLPGPLQASPLFVWDGWLLYRASSALVARRPDGGFDAIDVPGEEQLPYGPSLGTEAVVYFLLEFRAGGIEWSLVRSAIGPAGLGPPQVWATSQDSADLGDLLIPIFSFDLGAGLQIDRSRADAACLMGRTEVPPEGLAATAVYRASADGLERVADTDTAIPYGHGTFTEFGWECAIDRGTIAFVGRGERGQEGVYVQAAGGALDKLVDRDDAIDEVQIEQFDVRGQGLLDGELVFAARHVDASSARWKVWITALPEPDVGWCGSIAWLALAVLARVRALGACAGRRRRSGSSS